MGRQPACLPLSLQRLANRCCASCLELLLANRCMLMLFIRGCGEGRKGDVFSRKEFVFPSRFSVDVKKEKKIGFETDFEKCELISLLFNTGKTKPFQTTQLFEEPVPKFHRLCGFEHLHPLIRICVALEGVF